MSQYLRRAAGSVLFSFFLLLNSAAASTISWEIQSKEPAIQESVIKTLTSFSNEDFAGAVLMPSFEKNMKAETFGKTLCDIHARSYIILRSDTSKKLTSAVQKAYDKACPKRPVKLIVALDAEPSLMQYRMPSVKVPNTNKLSDTKSVEDAAQKIAKALLDAGIEINFAPVYDVSNNEAIINNRAFGDFIHTNDVITRANVYANATWEAGIIPTAKHFPGHGLVKNDSHKVPVTIFGSPQEIPQFVSAIGNGIPMIMVGHIHITGGEYDTRGLPSTLSKSIMTDLLKNQLGFNGVVVTDSMAMGALTGQKARTTRTLEAGADLVLIPPDPRASYEAILEKMKKDPAFANRVRDAVKRFQAVYVTYKLNKEVQPN